jgi:hypothetical protein
MVHIGSERLYKAVVNDPEAALADGYSLFYEGVLSSDADAHRRLSELIGTSADLEASYESLAELRGQPFQRAMST